MFTKSIGPTKMERAVTIFSGLADKEGTMSSYEFRKMVIAAMTEQLNLTSDGARGLYYAHARHTVLGTPQRKYDGSVRKIIAEKHKELKKQYKIESALQRHKERLDKKNEVVAESSGEKLTYTWDELQALVAQKQQQKENEE